MQCGSCICLMSEGRKSIQYMAKASFSTDLLGKVLVKTGEKVHLSTQKARPILVVLSIPSLLKFSPFLPQNG